MLLEVFLVWNVVFWTVHTLIDRLDLQETEIMNVFLYQDYVFYVGGLQGHSTLHKNELSQ